MKTFEQIYNEMCNKGDHHFSIREALTIFGTEDGNWVADRQQTLELQSMQLELTGIRPGTCSGCMVEVVKNMTRWVDKYEAEHPVVEAAPIEVETKPKRKRGLQ